VQEKDLKLLMLLATEISLAEELREEGFTAWQTEFLNRQPNNY
jgi:hypothetical protein